MCSPEQAVAGKHFNKKMTICLYNTLVTCSNAFDNHYDVSCYCQKIASRAQLNNQFTTGFGTKDQNDGDSAMV